MNKKRLKLLLWIPEVLAIIWIILLYPQSSFGQGLPSPGFANSIFSAAIVFALIYGLAMIIFMRNIR